MEKELSDLFNEAFKLVDEVLGNKDLKKEDIDKDLVNLFNGVVKVINNSLDISDLEREIVKSESKLRKTETLRLLAKMHGNENKENDKILEKQKDLIKRQKERVVEIKGYLNWISVLASRVNIEEEDKSGKVVETLKWIAKSNVDNYKEVDKLI